jgi:large subunit ribosomal protein L9
VFALRCGRVFKESIMKVILLQNVYKHGVAGEIIEVADGFARNYLIPTKRAVQATKSAIKSHERLMKQVEQRRAEFEKLVNEVAEAIDGTELFFERRAAATGKLFGSVTSQDITDELMRVTGRDINRRRLTVQGVREIGHHVIPVRLGTDRMPVLHVYVVREGELQEFLAKRAAQKAAEQAAAEQAAAE